MSKQIKSEPKITKRPLTALAKKFFLVYEKPLAGGVLAFAFYAIIAIYYKLWGTTTPGNYYSYLADAFAHGQLYLRLQPSQTLDLVYYQDKLYLYWPPLPAVLTIPLVLLFGVNFSDIIFTIVVGSLNVTIVAQLLRKCNDRSLLNLTAIQRGLLVFVFGFGTALVPLAIMGTVWSISIIMGLMFVGLTYLSAVSLHGWKSFFMAGLSIAAALATRNTLILAGIWPAYYLLQLNWSLPWKKKFVYAFLGVMPILLILAVLGLYNYARFGSFTDIGYAYHNMHPFFRPDFEKYGAFSLHYIPRNLYYQWIAYPFFTKKSLEIVMGGSLLLLTPVFLGMFWAVKNRSLRSHVAVLALTIFMVYIPIVLLMGTGFIQLGPRYLLDFMVPLRILTGMGIKFWPTRVTGILVAISFLHYLGLVIWAW